MHQITKRGIKVTYVPTTEKAADSLTKGLGASAYHVFEKTLTSPQAPHQNFY